jgi:lipid-A-disaccharide synthase
MRYFLVAGEASGDLHGSNLMISLKKSDPGAEFYCWGGDLMQKAGGKLLMHYRETAFMGFVTVLKNLRKIASNFKLCRKQLAETKPDLVILIDYPGFNLRIARFCHESHLKVFYYISPKIWAWKESRVEKIKKYVNRMFIIFPFETGFYARHGVETKYMGNPLVDEVNKRKSELDSEVKIRESLGLGNQRIITILAGSRKHEVKYILPPLLKIIPLFPDHSFVLAAVDTISPDYYRKFSAQTPLKIITGKTYELFSVSEAALVKSGTSTLEAALLGVPQVVVYAGDTVSFNIARLLVKVKHVSLVNLILRREAVRELLQFLMTTENLSSELNAILPGGVKREKVLSDYAELKDILGEPGASDRIAAEMFKAISEKK